MISNHKIAGVLALITMISLSHPVFAAPKTDAVTKATTAVVDPIADSVVKNPKVLLVLVASRNGSTAKVASAIADVLDARIKSPKQVSPEDLKDCSLIGFGSGIFDQKHHLRSLANRLLGEEPRFPNLA